MELGVGKPVHPRSKDQRREGNQKPLLGTFLHRPGKRVRTCAMQLVVLGTVLLLSMVGTAVQQATLNAWHVSHMTLGSSVLAGSEASLGQTDPLQCTAEEMEADFEDADTDGSGEVTPVELQAWTGAAEWSSDHIELGIFADADGNDKLSLQEFMHYHGMTRECQ